MDKQNVVYPQKGMILNHNKNGIIRHTTTWMNFEFIMLNGRSQTQKVNYCMILFIGNVQIRQIHDTGNNLVM